MCVIKKHNKILPSIKKEKRRNTYTQRIYIIKEVKMLAQHLAMSPQRAQKSVRISDAVEESQPSSRRRESREGRRRRNALTMLDANKSFRSASAMNKKEKAMRRTSQRILKVLVVGNASSGKSSLVRRYVHGDFTASSTPTIGADFQRKDVRYGETIYRLQLWDIAGQDRFVHLARAYFKDAAAAIVACDASRISTILAAEKWLEELHNKVVKAGFKIPVVLAINKMDLLDEKTKKMVLETVESLNKISDFTKYHFTSAKTGQNVKDIIRSILSTIDKKRRLDREKKKGKAKVSKRLSKRPSTRRHRRTAIVERNHSHSKSFILDDQQGRVKSAKVVSVTHINDNEGESVEVLPSDLSNNTTTSSSFMDEERVILHSESCSTGCGTMSTGCC